MKRGQSGLNCLLALDKPVGPSSHDVVNRVRRALGERRVGHAGTLDPAASGVLVVGVGLATRLLGMLTLDEKAYEATICFGAETTTDDAEGEVTRTAAVPAELSDEAFAARSIAALVGSIDQVPPSFSAISVDGRRAYDRARAGEHVELEARHITIHEARLLALEPGEQVRWNIYCHVSKGTYVRAIARDLGRSFGSAAYLSSLRRVASGDVCVDSCVSLEELESGGLVFARDHCLDPVTALGHPFRALAASELDDVSCGRRIDAGIVVDRTGTLREPCQNELVSLVSQGTLVGVWRREGSTLKCESNFPQGIIGVGRG